MTSSQSDTFKQSYETLRLFNCELNFEWHAARTSQAEMASLPRASEALSRLHEKKIKKMHKIVISLFQGLTQPASTNQAVAGFCFGFKKICTKNQI